MVRKHLVRAGMTLSMIALSAVAQAFPDRPVNIVVPYPPGGAIDPIARVYAAQLQEAWKVPVVVLNRPGAGTTIGLNSVAQAEPDGYTVVLGTGSVGTNPAMYEKLPYDTLKDFTYISLAAVIPVALTANPKVPANTLPELIEYLKTNPGKATYSSSGNGTILHLGGELFKSMTGTDILHVPYKGSSASVMAGMAGEVDLVLDTIFLQKPQVEAGKLKFIATAGDKRSELTPDVPTIAESYPGYSVVTWAGFMGPAGMPADITKKWADEVARISNMQEVKDKLLAQGTEPAANSPEEFRAYVTAEIEKWQKVARDAKIPKVQ